MASSGNGLGIERRGRLMPIAGLLVGFAILASHVFPPAAESQPDLEALEGDGTAERREERGGTGPDIGDDTGSDPIISDLLDDPLLRAPSASWFDSTVVARVGSDVVTAGDLFYALDKGREIDLSLPSDSLKALLVERTVNQRLLVREGYNRRYDLTDVVRGYAARMREKLAGNELRRRIYAGKLDIYESELRELYERYYYTLRVRHLNVDRRDLAEEILARLKAGEDYGTLARRYSRHRKTAELGGDMGEVKAGRMIIDFEDAVFPLSPGELTGVIKGKGENYKIFKLESKVRDRTPPASFEEMRVLMARRVRTRKAGDALYAWQLSMFEKYEAEIDEDNYVTFARTLRDRLASWEAINAVHRDSLAQTWIFTGWPRDVLDLPLAHWTAGGELTVAQFNKESRESQHAPTDLWRDSDVRLRQFVKGAVFNYLYEAERQKIIDERLPIIEIEVERRMEDRMTKMVGSTLTTFAREIPALEARAYWEQHKDEYTRPAQARARRVVVETEAQAHDILRRLAGGADFAALAERFSKDDATSRRGGETPLFGPGSMQGMGDVALEHEPGELIPVFRSRLGWEVVEVLEKIPPRLQTFEEAKGAVMVRLATGRTDAEINRVIDEARQRTRIEIDEEALDRLRLPS